MEDTFWSLVSELSLLCKLHKYLQHLCWARVPLVICTCPHFSFQIIWNIVHQSAHPVPRTFAPQYRKVGFQWRWFYICWLSYRDTGLEWPSHLVFKTCEAAAECRTGAALCRRSQVCCGTFVSQLTRACTWQPASAHSHPLKDTACSWVCSFHCAIFSKFLSQALALFMCPWASETNWPFSCSSKLCSLSWECFWLQTRTIWVCLTAGMFSNSMGACLPLAFCLLQHSEIINK